MWERSNGDRDWLPPVGDSSRGAGDRLRGALLEIAAHETRGEAIVVTHGGIIADLLLNLFPVAEIEAKNPTYLHLKHCSVTTLSCQGDHFELLSAGAVDHLRTTITG
jgi:broad specificity phosphatase PhoE